MNVEDILSKKWKVEKKLNEVTEGDFFHGLDGRGVETLDTDEMDKLIKKYPQSEDLINKAIELEIKHFKKEGFTPKESVIELKSHLEQKNLKAW